MLKDRAKCLDQRVKIKMLKDNLICQDKIAMIQNNKTIKDKHKCQDKIYKIKDNKTLKMEFKCLERKAKKKIQILTDKVK